MPIESDISDLQQIVYRAAGREEVRRAVEGVYADLQTAIDQRRPLCSASGRCCRFEEFGHRLFVTTIELAAFLASAPGHAEPWDGGGCPFQMSGLCSVHAIRPFGCRVFFCDPSSTECQSEQYERLHARLKRLHEELAIPYFYVEWRQAL